MDFSAIKDLYIGSTPGQSAWLNGSKVWGRKPTVDEQSIRDAMILWYDLKKQGATNESMAADPVLRDLSGNGHDATCYNFAWSGMSGIGGDIAPLIALNQILGSSENFKKDPDAEIINFRKFVINGNSNVYISFYSQDISDDALGSTITLGSFQFIVSGLKDGDRVSVTEWYGDNFTDSKTINCDSNGLYIFPELSVNIPSSVESGRYITQLEFGGKDSIKSNSNVTIEILPQYPNALVSDGVDDYCYTNGLPILTDYTVIAKREWLSNQPRDTFASKSETAGQGAFIFEINDPNAEIYSYGASNDVDIVSNIISYQTTNEYNGKKINRGSGEDSDKLWISKLRNADADIGAFALYSFLLFDRTLTTAEIEWVKKNMIEGNDDDVDWYGVEFYTTSPNPDCIRIGNPELHRALPVHSQMKGCLLADDGSVNKYLNETDWTSETLDGSQGQVMVEMPKESYWKFETDGNIRRVKFSTKPLPGFKKTPQGYVSAYEAALQRSTNKLSSVVNTTTDYRGGDNNAEWDGTYRSLLGMPATEISRTDFRNYARNRKADSTKWNCMTYDMQKLLYWLFVVEYATLNTQKAFNSAKDSSGYAQGGLGDGFATLDWNKWTNFNGNYPVVPCGYTDELGNGTGQKEYSMPSEYDATIKKLYVPRYRGVENPFGHIWQLTDGINVQIEPSGGLSKVFVCDDPSKFNDSNYDGYQHVGNEARTEAYVKSVIFGEKGEIIPDVVGGSSPTYFCDRHYTSILNTETLHGVLFGGCANDGSGAGFVCAYSRRAPSYLREHVGSRLCFIPNNND